MVLGIGTDILEIERMQKAVDNRRFLEKVFTGNEILFFETLCGGGAFNKKAYESMAGNFTVKEAVAKALGTGFVSFSARDIEVLRDASGKPYVNLFKEAQRINEALGVRKIHVSMSHCKQYAVAHVILEGDCVENSSCQSNEAN